MAITCNTYNIPTLTILKSSFIISDIAKSVSSYRKKSTSNTLIWNLAKLFNFTFINSSSFKKPTDIFKIVYEVNKATIMAQTNPTAFFAKKPYVVVTAGFSKGKSCPNSEAVTAGFSFGKSCPNSEAVTTSSQWQIKPKVLFDVTKQDSTQIKLFITNYYEVEYLKKKVLEFIVAFQTS